MTIHWHRELRTYKCVVKWTEMYVCIYIYIFFFFIEHICMFIVLCQLMVTWHVNKQTICSKWDLAAVYLHEVKPRCPRWLRAHSCCYWASLGTSLEPSSGPEHTQHHQTQSNPVETSHYNPFVLRFKTRDIWPFNSHFWHKLTFL